MNDTKILLIVAFDGYHQVEYEEPKKILEDAGFIVITASNKPGFALAKDGSTTHVDITLDKVHVNDYAAVFFIGGPGALENLDTNASHTIINETYKQNKPLGAICSSTRILASSGVLSGKRATGWNGDGKLGTILKHFHAEYDTTQEVVVDDGIITATGPAAAQEFGEKIVALLQDKQGWG